MRGRVRRKARVPIRIESSESRTFWLNKLAGAAPRTLPGWPREMQAGGPEQVIFTRNATEAINLARERAIPLFGLGVGVPGIVDPGPESLVSAPALGWKEGSDFRFTVPYERVEE